MTLGLSNLPPGCSEGDIPGNRLEDQMWEEAEDALDIVDMCDRHHNDCEFAEFIHEGTSFADFRGCTRFVVAVTPDLDHRCRAKLLIGMSYADSCPYHEAEVEGIYENLLDAHYYSGTEWSWEPELDMLGYPRD